VVALGSLPQVLAAFCPRFPLVGVVVRSGSTESLVPRLLAGELHFVVADYEALEAHPELQVRSLGADPIGVAARPGHPLCGASAPALTEVLRFPRGSATAPPRIRQWLRTQPGGDELRQSLTCDNYEVLVAVAEESDTLVLGPISMLRRYERAGRLVVLPIAYPSPPSEPAVLSVRDRPLAPAVVALMKEFGDA
jgi:DNA-binding transcriptional LysR family regulator